MINFQKSEPRVDSTGAAAIFSNSAIDLNGVCYLNDSLNDNVKHEPAEYDNELVSYIHLYLLHIIIYIIILI